MKMNRRDFIGTTSVAGLGALAGCRRASARKPNVVFILTDQWRADALGYAGDPHVQTPHLDALASESFNFENAVACCPVCCPARASFVTGQYPLTHGVFVNDVHLEHRNPSIADCFNAAGYRTGWIGKWHMDGHGRSTFIPRERRQGFQYFKALECTHNYNNSAYYDNDDPEIKTWDGYDVFAQTDDAIEFIRETSPQPFFLVLAWGPPHDPYLTAPRGYRDQYDPDELTLRRNVPRTEEEIVPRPVHKESAETLLETPALMTAGYYAHCTAMDDSVARLQDAIRQAGLEEDTIFVFTSDHGDMLGSHGQWNKQQPYDESARIPFLLKYPRLGKGGVSVQTPINIPDWMPTLCDLCGIPVPSSVEGRNFAPEMRAGNWEDDAALIANYHAFGQWNPRRGGKEWRGIRTIRYTYVKDLDGPWMLFDNESDPYQMDNLVNRPEHADLQARMEVLLQEKLQQTDDEFAPGMEYIRRWNYTVDETGTVRYTT